MRGWPTISIIAFWGLLIALCPAIADDGKGGEKMSRVAVEKCDTQVIDKHPVFILSRLSFKILV